MGGFSRGRRRAQGAWCMRWAGHISAGLAPFCLVGPHGSQITAHLSIIGGATEDVVKAAGFVASTGANMTVVASHRAAGAISISVSAAKLLAWRERSPTGLSQRRLAAHCSEGGGHDKQGCRSVIEHFVDVGTQFFLEFMKNAVRVRVSGMLRGLFLHSVCGRCAIAVFWPLRMCRGGRDLHWVPEAQNLDQSAW